MLASGRQAHDRVLSGRQQPQAERQGQFEVAAEPLAVFFCQVADKVHVQLLVNCEAVCF